MRILKKDLIYFIYIIISIFLAIINFNRDYYIQFLCFLVVLSIIINIIYLKINKINLFSISGLFILFSYEFHFGQLFLYCFVKNYEFTIANVIYNDYNNAKLAFLFSFITIFFVILGMRWMNEKIKTNETNELYQPLEKKIYIMLASLILAISLPITLYIDINKIIRFVESGYQVSYEFRLNGVLTQLASFYYVGIILFILAFRDNKKIASFITLLLLSYQVLSMLTGNRGIQLIRIIFTLLIYYKYVRKISICEIIIILIAGVLGLKFISSLAIIRNNSFENLATFFDILFNTSNDPFYSIMEENGYTIQTLVLLFRNNYLLDFGKTYLYSFATVLPNIGEFLHQINFEACFVNMLNYPNIGGSYIAELFYNFSWLGSFFGFFIGMLVQYVSNKLDKAVKNNNVFVISIFVLPSISILWWVRNYFKDMPREFIWGLVIFYILYKFILYLLKNKNNKSNPKVSIIMSVYNTELEYLKEAINSIINQTYKNIEFIIVNDCSTNNDVNIYLENLIDQRIKLIKNNTNLGFTKSLNNALKLATGDFIARMDSDDVSFLDRIIYQVDFFNRHPDIDVLGGSTQNIGDDFSINIHNDKHENIKASLLFGNKYLVHPTIIFRRKIIDAGHFYDEKYSKSQDYAFWCELINNYTFLNDSRIVLNYRIHKNQAGIANISTQNECSNLIRSEFAKHINLDSQFATLLNNFSVLHLSDINELNKLANIIIQNNKIFCYFDQKSLYINLKAYYFPQWIRIFYTSKNKISILLKTKYRYLFSYKGIKNLLKILKNYIISK